MRRPRERRTRVVPLTQFSMRHKSVNLTKVTQLLAGLFVYCLPKNLLPNVTVPFVDSPDPELTSQGCHRIDLSKQGKPCVQRAAFHKWFGLWNYEDDTHEFMTRTHLSPASLHVHVLEPENLT